MLKIGIDFGTTNSTIAYCDGNGGIVGHRFGGIGTEYIPSAIAYSKLNTDEVLIGKIARSAYDNEPDNYYYYEHYKLALCSYYKQVVIPKGGEREHGKTAIELVKDYIHHLIALYKRENKIKQDRLEFIALAIPNVIKGSVISSEKENELREAGFIKEELISFLKTEGDKAILESESVCACEFFITRPENKDFDGSVVVVDYGGGTLDITNCKISRNLDNSYAISVISQRGTSVDDRNTFGFAGVAFDREVVRRVLENLHEPIEIDEYLLRSFETYKVEPGNHIRVTEALKRYYQNGYDDTNLLWTVDRNSVYSLSTMLLDEAFEEANAEKLVQHFNRVISQEDIDTGIGADQDHFRVLLIGGFSQLYCVENKIMEILQVGLLREADLRIPQMSMNEKFIAVSYGAAILANRQISSTYTVEQSPFEVGIKAYDGNNYFNVPFIRENEIIKSRQHVDWRELKAYPIIIPDKVIITIYCKAGNREEGKFDLDISKACSSNSELKFLVAYLDEKWTLIVYNDNNKKQFEFDITQLIQKYVDRN